MDQSERVEHALPSSNMYDNLLLSAKPSILPTLYPLPLLTPYPYHSLTNQTTVKIQPIGELGKTLKQSDKHTN